MNALLLGLKSLGAGRLIAMAAVAFAMMGLLTVLAMHGPSERMALLYSDLDLREAGQIVDVLERQKIAHQIGPGGNQVLVSADQVANARLLLAKEGLPTGGSIGYEIFDRGDNLTASQFQQSINQARALEGELARTIRGIQGVKAARVHLVLPKREPFARDRQDAQASIQIAMAGTTRLDNEGTRAILNLVAAAVPGLRPQNIALTDTRGNLLARAGEPTGPAADAAGDSRRLAAESRLARAVEEMLERSLGPGRVRAEASIDFDYDQVHETQEHYDPDGQVVRSTQTVTNNNKSTEATGSVSVQNNLPNADAGANNAGTSEQRQEETTNYEIAKTVRTIVHDQPKIAKLSLAVMVDGIMAKADDGSMVWKERPAEELDRISKLVRSAVGYDEKRGDKVEVVSLRFVLDPETGDTGQPAALFMGLGKADILQLLQAGMYGVLALLAILLVLRPMIGRLTVNPVTTALLQGADGSSLATAIGQDGRPVGEMLPFGGRQQALPAPSQARSGSGTELTSALDDDSLVNLANVEGQLRASSIRRVAELVDKHPEESMSIMRAWMHQEAS